MAHRNARNAANGYRTFTLSCWQGICYTSTSLLPWASAKSQPLAASSPLHLLPNSLHHGLGRKKYIFRWQDHIKGHFTQKHNEVNHFLNRLYELCSENDIHLSHYRIHGAGRPLDLTAAAKHAKRQQQQQQRQQPQRHADPGKPKKVSSSIST
jgi:hypothetical protein